MTSKLVSTVRNTAAVLLTSLLLHGQIKTQLPRPDSSSFFKLPSTESIFRIENSQKLVFPPKTQVQYPLVELLPTYGGRALASMVGDTFYYVFNPPNSPNVSYHLAGYTAWDSVTDQVVSIPLLAAAKLDFGKHLVDLRDGDEISIGCQPWVVTRNCQDIWCYHGTYVDIGSEKRRLTVHDNDTLDYGRSGRLMIANVAQNSFSFRIIDKSTGQTVVDSGYSACPKTWSSSSGGTCRNIDTTDDHQPLSVNLISIDSTKSEAEIALLNRVVQLNPFQNVAVNPGAGCSYGYRDGMFSTPGPDPTYGTNLFTTGVQLYTLWDSTHTTEYYLHSYDVGIVDGFNVGYCPNGNNIYIIEDSTWGFNRKGNKTPYSHPNLNRRYAPGESFGLTAFPAARFRFDGLVDSAGHPMAQWSVLTACDSGFTSVNEKPMWSARFQPFIYPNPFDESSGAHLVFDIPHEAEIKVTITNVLGNEMVLFSGNQPAGHVEFNFRPEGIPSGVYYCRIEMDGQLVGTTQMILLR